LQIKEVNQSNNGLSIVIQNVQERLFSTLEEAQSILNHALERRQVHETTKNIESSRSHAIFMVKLYANDASMMSEFDRNLLGYLGGSKYSQQNLSLQKQLEQQSSMVSQFTFIDLAGSEKLDGESDPKRICEAKHINKSLSALGSVIQALKNKHDNEYLKAGGRKSPKKSSVADDLSSNSFSLAQQHQARHSQQPPAHIPYRDCKLTHLLKPCFNNGNSLTHLLICLSPCQSSM